MPFIWISKVFGHQRFPLLNFLSHLTLPLPGDGDILLEWRRPKTTHGRVNFYVIYYKSDQVTIRMSLIMTIMRVVTLTLISNKKWIPPEMLEPVLGSVPIEEEGGGYPGQHL